MAENVDQRLNHDLRYLACCFLCNKRAARKEQNQLSNSAKEMLLSKIDLVEAVQTFVEAKFREKIANFDDGRPDVELEKLSCQFREHVYVFRVRVSRLLLLVHVILAFCSRRRFSKVLAKRL